MHVVIWSASWGLSGLSDRYLETMVLLGEELD